MQLARLLGLRSHNLWDCVKRRAEGAHGTGRIAVFSTFWSGN